MYVCVFKNIPSSSHMGNPEKLHFMCGPGMADRPERWKYDVLNLSKKEEKPLVLQFVVVSVSVHAGGYVPAKPAGYFSEWSLRSSKS